MATTVAAVNKSAGAKKAAALAKKKTQVAQDAADILQAMNVVTPQVVNEPSRDNYTAPVPAPTIPLTVDFPATSPQSIASRLPFS